MLWGKKTQPYKTLLQDKQIYSVLFQIFLFHAQFGLVQKFLCSLLLTCC